MPKPLPQHPGSGLHIHLKLFKEGKNLFYDSKSSVLNLSQTALYFIGGILKHSPSLLSFTNPSINSYKRLVKGYEAPIAITFGAGNRTSAIRIPSYAQSEMDKRMEFRPQDATCNPYLSFSAILLAGLDGIINKIDPIVEEYGPFEGNVYESEKISYLPSSLEEALQNLERDSAYLFYENAVPENLVQQWINLKKKEVETYKSHIVSPWEYKKYYSC
jgi:glutamine synthetase